MSDCLKTLVGLIGIEPEDLLTAICFPVSGRVMTTMDFKELRISLWTRPDTGELHKVVAWYSPPIGSMRDLSPVIYECRFYGVAQRFFLARQFLRPVGAAFIGPLD